MLEELTPQILRLPQEQRNILLQQWQDLRAISELHNIGRTRFSLDTLRWAPASPIPSQRAPPPPTTRPLATNREVSSIPRATSTSQTLNSAERAALPANSEQDTGHDRHTGNWIYPSQSQFFAAMQRKGHKPEAADMQTIVPIHNAVNERTWREVLRWEEGRGGASTQTQGGDQEGPRLVSFAGDSKALTPRARWNGLWGWKRPFDRHDWVVERSGGERVEYVIDFYEGRGADGKVGGGPLNFYLDVRPKLNSWEGVKTRLGRAVGL